MSEVRLLDEYGQSVAMIAADRLTHDTVQGKIIEQHFTDEMIRIFSAFQEMVEHQMFGYLDQITQYVESLNLRVQIDDAIYAIYDLQVYDLTQISFSFALDLGQDTDG